MRPHVIAIAVGGLLTVSVILLALPIGRDGHSASAEGEMPALESELQQETVVSADVQGRVGLPVSRNVASELVTQTQVGQQSLERVAARAPLTPLAVPDPEPAAPGDGQIERLLYRPLAVGAGEFVAQNYRVILAGLEATDKSEMCGSGLDAWPCGLHARTAFRNWLRGRAITCKVPPSPPATTINAECQLADQDPAEWLVSQGWVRATATGPYAAIGARAETEERGLFGSAPVATLPVTSTDSETSGG